MDLLAISRDLIAADTVSPKGTAAAVAVLRPLYERIGLTVTVQERLLGDHLHGSAHHQNLLGAFPGADPAGLVLSAHLDTPDPGLAELWTETDNTPLWLTQKGDQLYGLGAADAKLAAVCQLFAARDFQGRPLRRALYLLGTFGAELASDGARHFAQSRDRLARFAAVAEPTGLSLARAHKGRTAVGVELVLPDAPILPGPFERVLFETPRALAASPGPPSALELSLKAHAGAPLLSLEASADPRCLPSMSAVVRPVGPTGPKDPKSIPASPPDTRSARATVDLAARLFELWRSRADALEPRSHEAFPGERCQVAWTAARVSGPRAELVFEARLLPGQESDALTTAFSLEAERLGQGARVRSTVLQAQPALVLAEGSELLTAARAACRDVALDDTPQAWPATTEAGFLARAGMDALAFGPGRLQGGLQGPNESNQLSQMEKAIGFYRALIARLCT